MGAGWMGLLVGVWVAFGLEVVIVFKQAKQLIRMRYRLLLTHRLLISILPTPYLVAVMRIL